MIYRNKKSGATFTTSCACAGEDWEEVKAPAPKTKGGKKQEAAETETSDGDAENP